VSDTHTQALDELEYLDRMLDYARAIHSLPESVAVEGDGQPGKHTRRGMDQAGVYGPHWNREVCDCKLYDYPHAGTPGPAANCLPRGWKSGDEPIRAA
jgi:hypothetical protein